MTKEQAIEILRYNSNVIHQTINGETDPNEVEALDMAIKALEQQTSEDCVSREAVLKGYIEIERADGVEVYSDRVISKEYVEALPPVTPTHGNCDDCHYSLEKNNFQICTKYHEIVKRHGFYCADYEKRGNE